LQKSAIYPRKRENPDKNKKPTPYSVVVLSLGLPLTWLPVAIGKNHIVQVAHDPVFQHIVITLLSSVCMFSIQEVKTFYKGQN
jgi:hypothetical protein